MVLVLSMLLGACAPAVTPAPAATQPSAAQPAATEPPAQQPAATEAPAQPPAAAEVTLTVWDYYGEATPIKPLIEPFEKENPGIKIKYEAIDWDTMLEKMNVILTGGEPPDVATADMTWLPKYASLDAFADLKQLSGGKVNDTTWEQLYAPGALEAISFKDKYVAALYDFDVYALYYRADLFEQKGIQVPKTWDELAAAAKKLAEGDKYLYEFDADTFHGSQWIFENGGTLMNADNTKCAFNSPEAVKAISTYSDLLLKDKVAIDWTVDQGERIQGVKDGRIGMFSDGPYYMGILKSAAPEMEGKWKVALHPTGNVPGSYLGGTGLVVPSGSKNKEAAWKFIQFALRTENMIGLYKASGAAPATTPALQSPEVAQAEAYFGGQKPLAAFLETLKTAHHFPYVRQWSDIDELFTTAMQEIALGQKPVQEALDGAASQCEEKLK
jgi:multiple sugar transport system substrate-binding protein